MKTFTEDQIETRESECLACGGEADGELVCARCDIEEDSRARRREDQCL